MERFANEGGMLPEQVWDAPDIPDARMYRGAPTGSAMPLCWAHGEYLTLVRSRKEGTGFDLIPPAHERYVVQKVSGSVEIWTFAHQPARVRRGKTLRLIIGSSAAVRWTADGWRTTRSDTALDSGLRCWFVDLPTAAFPAGAKIEFTFDWPDQRKEGNFLVELL